jgi:hypothetical protein
MFITFHVALFQIRTKCTRAASNKVCVVPDVTPLKMLHVSFLYTFSEALIYLEIT